MNNTLRPYQEAAIAASRQSLTQGITRQIWSLATGTGKTFTGTTYAQQRGLPTLWLVHRDELVRQAAESFSKGWPEASVGIVKAAEDDYEAPVVVASVQSLSAKRLTRWTPDRFGTVIVDECHHAPAISYRKILDYLHPQLLLGLTATPYRSDKASLGEVFDKIVHSYGIQEGIRDGYLVDIRAFRVEGKADLDEVHTSGGDFNQTELSRALNTPPRNRLIVDAYQQHAAGTRAIGFTAGVQHAYNLATMFRDAGIPAEAIDGSMPLDDRRAVLARLKTGETLVVLNDSVLSEGFDEPAVRTVILARPTKSLALFTQMVGRGTRPSPETGKTHMVLLDIVDSTRRHKLMTVKDLIGLRKDPKDGTSVAERMTQESRLSDEAERWLTRLHLHSEDVLDLFESLTDDPAPSVDWRDLLDDLTTIADDPDRRSEVERYYARFMQNPLDPATALQQTRLAEFGWLPDIASTLTKWEASYALDKHRDILAQWSAHRAGTLAQLMGWDPQQAQAAMANQLWQLTPATPKQRALLHRLHVPEELIVTVTKGEASQLIDTGLAAWKGGAPAHA
ncbi:DEAD/DEAH box helicase [Sulfobacillus sp. hq2]|uniref:DEAD/DEAH box helicase n=1 Tax=Sulfobacillus TaxID=28033 RepID=UPI001FA93543|nr:DEAD/DEAH box helicase [Sulfobacillus sp. hq2]